MAVPKTLASILKNPTKSLLRRHFTTTCASSTFPSSLSFALRLTSSHPRLFSPTWGQIPSPSGPLFLSSPPWMLSQFATPLYLQGEVVGSPREVVVRKRLDFGTEKRGGGEGKGSGEGGNGGGVVVDRILNLPNLISISRMVSGPVIGWMIINAWYLPSFVALAISGMTDWLDGYAARKMNINSVLGSYLDPLADKVLIACVAVAMVKKDLLHPGLIQLVVLRDVGLIGGSVYKRASTLDWKWKSWSDFVSLNTTHPEKVEPLFISKVNTVFQLILVASALLQPEFGTEETQAYITYLSWLVASTTVGSSLAYGAQHLRMKAPSVGVR